MIYFMTGKNMSHNSMRYRGKNLANCWGGGYLLYDLVEEIHQRILRGFDDLYLGDHFNVSITTKFGTENVKLYISDYNIFKYDKAPGALGQAITQNHIVLVPQYPFMTQHKMNPTASTFGGLIKTDLYVNILPEYEKALLEVLNNHLLLVRDVVMTEGDQFANTGHERYIQLLTEEMITGVGKTSYNCMDCSNLYHRLKIFEYKKSFATTFKNLTDTGSGMRYWLQNIHSSTEFTMYGAYGGCKPTAANSTDIYIRPFMCMC